MGIVNTFPACLESPYLVQDLDAPGQVGELMELAADRLAAATDLFESGQGDQADVTFFSYESMFACVRALVYSCGLRERGLRCLLLACEHFFVRPGLLETDHLLAFERAQGHKTSPAENLKAATELAEKTLLLLNSQEPKANR